jgi:hypothetical protein
VSSHSARPANQLQEEDFRSSAVWRFITPDESEELNADESFVVPELSPPGTGQYGSFLVAAQYELKGGTVLPGVVQVDILNTQIEFTPSTVFAAGRSVDPLGHDTAKKLQRLLKATDTQPKRWRLHCALDDEKTVRTGSINKPGLSQVLGLLAQLARLKRSR